MPGDNRMDLPNKLVQMILKGCLIGATTLCGAMGIVICASAIWIMMDSSFAKDVEEDTELHGLQYRAWILLVPGVVLIIDNCAGLIGAFCGKPKFLVAFFVINLILFLLLVTATSAALAHSDEITNLVDKVLAENVQHSLVDNSTRARNFMISVQSSLKCCGLDGIADYDGNDYLKRTCYVREKHQYHEEGCQSALKEMFAANIVIIAVLIFILLLIMFLAMAFSCALRRFIIRKKHYLEERARTDWGEVNRGRNDSELEQIPSAPSKSSLASVF